MSLIQKWNSYRRSRRERAESRRAEKERLDKAFKVFVEETESLTPYAPKHPKAALYRHAWRRAEIYKQLTARSDDQRVSALCTDYSKFADRAAKDYYRVAPSNAYGTVRLEMTEKQANAILDWERRRLRSSEHRAHGETACIYLGECSRTAKKYVGQTVGAPEKRWLQHRMEGTGPFKDGDLAPDFSILELPVEIEKLDERESYWIGYCDTYESGLNETRGNNRAAYERGLKMGATVVR